METLIEAIKLAKPETDIEVFINATDLYGQGILDSYDILILIDEICAAFGIEIGSGDLRREDFRTIDSLYALVKRKGA